MRLSRTPIGIATRAVDQMPMVYIRRCSLEVKGECEDVVFRLVRRAEKGFCAIARSSAPRTNEDALGKVAIPRQIHWAPATSQSFQGPRYHIPNSSVTLREVASRHIIHQKPASSLCTRYPRYLIPNLLVPPPIYVYVHYPKNYISILPQLLSVVTGV